MLRQRRPYSEAVHERAHDVVARHEAAEQVEVGLDLEGAHEDAQPFAPRTRFVVAEVVEAGLLARGGEQRLLVEAYERGGRAPLASERDQVVGPFPPRR